MKTITKKTGWLNNLVSGTIRMVADSIATLINPHKDKRSKQEAKIKNKIDTNESINEIEPTAVIFSQVENILEQTIILDPDPNNEITQKTPPKPIAKKNFFYKTYPFDELDSAIKAAIEKNDEKYILTLKKNTIRKNMLDCALMYAVIEGRLNIVKTLVDLGANVNETTCSKYDTPFLLYAIAFCHEEIVDFLIQSGAKIDARSEYGLNAFMVAGQVGHVAILKLLFKHPKFNKSFLEEPSRGFKWGHLRTPLMFAVEGGSLESVQLFLNMGANLNQETFDENIGSALAMAAFHGHVDIFNELITRGANPDAQSGRYKQTPLMVAAKQGKLAIIKILIHLGDLTPTGLTLKQRLNVVDRISTNTGRGNNTAAMHALISNKMDALKLLIDAGADIKNIQNSSGDTLLAAAQRCGKLPDILNHILKKELFEKFLCLKAPYYELKRQEQKSFDNVSEVNVEEQVLSDFVESDSLNKKSHAKLEK